MGIMVYSLLWVMQDFVHQPYGFPLCKTRNKFWGRDDLDEDLFETWNPAAQPAENLTIKEATLNP